MALFRIIASACFAMLFCNSSAIGQQQKKSKPLIAPSTDFSKYDAKSPWQLPQEILRDLTVRHQNRDEAKVLPYSLPNLFVLIDGTKVDNTEIWKTKRREELLELFRREIYGFAPPRPETLAFQIIESDPKAMNGKATRKLIQLRFELAGETFTFNLHMFVPNERSGPAPIILLLNHRGPENTDPTRKIKSEFWPAEYAIERGYAMAAINVSDEVEPDSSNATTGVRAFYRKHHSSASDFTWGALAAWAWSGSRAVDYLVTDADINPKQIAVIGHSRSGKTALWAAAQDTRFAIACVNCAGEGGPALTRRNFGETLGQITKNFPHWFAPSYARYDGKEANLLIDQHQLIALVAPRGYHGGDATRDLHADPRGSWLSLVEASAVWALFNKTRTLQKEMPLVNDLLIDGPLAYHLREGGHALTTFDWKLYMDHADSILGRKP